MRAIRLLSTGPVLDAAAPEPVVGMDQAVIRTRRAGVFGPLPPAAGQIPGRDFAGVVDRLHESAETALRRRWVGQRVVGIPDTACAACDLCRAGLSAHCRARLSLGTAELPGCLAERFTLPLRNLVPIPDGLGDDEAVFAGPLASAIHAAQCARLEGGAFVTVLGDGVVALLCAQVLAARTPLVRLLGENPARFGVCEKWGVKHRHASEAGRRRDQAAVIECTGTTAGFALAAQIVRARGTIVLAGACGAPAGVDLAPIVEGEVAVVGARGGPVRDAVSLLSKGAVDVLSLAPRRVRPEAAPGAMGAGEAGVVIEF